MKKVLSIAMAVAVVLSLSVTAFADGEVTVTGSGNHNVNAKFVPDNTLAATVTWGNMNFTYTEADNTWSVANEDDNKVSVTNNSAHGSIDVGREYVDDDSDSIESTGFVPLIFNAHIESFVPGTTATTGTTDATTRDLKLGSSIAPNTSATGWLMFTNAGAMNGNFTGADDLNQSNFAKIGTLTLTISAAA